MAQKAGKVYDSAEEMIAAVSKETGVSPEDVRKVIRASFASTKDFILKELAEAQAEGQRKGQAGETLSDEVLEKVAGGIIVVGGRWSPGVSLFSQRFSLEPSIIDKIGWRRL